MYFPQNWKFGSALSKLRNNFGGFEPPTSHPPGYTGGLNPLCSEYLGKGQSLTNCIFIIRLLTEKTQGILPTLGFPDCEKDFHEVIGNKFCKVKTDKRFQPLPPPREGTTNLAY
jgi:hypothetical protein